MRKTYLGHSLRGEYTPFCLAGYIRFKAESDMALTTLVKEHDEKVLAAVAVAVNRM